MKPRTVPTSPKNRTSNGELESLYQSIPTIAPPRRIGGGLVAICVSLSIIVAVGADAGLHALARRFPGAAWLQYFSPAQIGEQIVVRQTVESDDPTADVVAAVQSSLGTVWQKKSSAVLAPSDRLGLVTFLTSDGVGVVIGGQPRESASTVIGLADGKRLTIRNVATDVYSGLRLIHVDGATRPMPLTEITSLRVGQDVWVLRYDSFSGGTAVARSSLASLRNLAPARSDAPLLSSSDTISRHVRLSQSFEANWKGAAVVTGSGQLIGILDGAGATADTVIPTEWLRSAFSPLTKGESIKRATLQVNYVDLAFAHGSNTELKKGALVTGSETPKIPAVVPNGAGAKAGLVSGDVITGIDEFPLTEFRSLSDAIASATPGERAVLHVVRAGKQLDLPVTLGTSAVETPGR